MPAIQKGQHMSENKPALEWRADDISYVAQQLLIGRSCALIGVGGIGKSRFLKHLALPVTREHYLKEHWQHFHFLSLDSHEVTHPSALAYYRRMALLLEPILQQSQPTLSVGNGLSMTNQELARQALFDRVDAALAANEERRLVFLFDAFDVAFQEVEPYFFRVLLALRNRGRGRVCYVVTGSNVPALVCDERSHRIVLDAFSELFDGNVRGLKPGEHDAQVLLEAEWQRREHPPPLRLQRTLLEITGAHAGMLRASLSVLLSDHGTLSRPDTVEQLIEQLLHDLLVISRCEQIWNSLSEVEQDCLKHLRQGMLTRSALGSSYPAQLVLDALHMLVRKGVLIEVQRNRSYSCFSPLLSAYIAQRFEAHIPGLQLDITNRRVWVDGILQPGHLTPREFALLTCLAAHASEICSREATTRAVYGEVYNPGPDDARLDALVERARKHIGDDPRSPRFLETVRGLGHRLNEYLGEHP